VVLLLGVSHQHRERCADARLVFLYRQGADRDQAGEKQQRHANAAPPDVSPGKQAPQPQGESEDGQQQERDLLVVDAPGLAGAVGCNVEQGPSQVGDALVFDARAFAGVDAAVGDIAFGRFLFQAVGEFDERRAVGLATDHAHGLVAFHHLHAGVVEDGAVLRDQDGVAWAQAGFLGEILSQIGQRHGRKGHAHELMAGIKEGAGVRDEMGLGGLPEIGANPAGLAFGGSMGIPRGGFQGRVGVVVEEGEGLGRAVGTAHDEERSLPHRVGACASKDGWVVAQPAGIQGDAAAVDARMADRCSLDGFGHRIKVRKPTRFDRLGEILDDPVDGHQGVVDLTGKSRDGLPCLCLVCRILLVDVVHEPGGAGCDQEYGDAKTKPKPATIKEAKSYRHPGFLGTRVKPCAQASRVALRFKMD